MDKLLRLDNRGFNWFNFWILRYPEFVLTTAREGKNL